MEMAAKVSNKQIQLYNQIVGLIRNIWSDFDISVNEVTYPNSQSVMKYSRRIISEFDFNIDSRVLHVIDNNPEAEIFKDILPSIITYTCLTKIFECLGLTKCFDSFTLWDFWKPNISSARSLYAVMSNFFNYAAELDIDIIQPVISEVTAALNSVTGLEKMIDQLQMNINDLTLEHMENAALIEKLQEECTALSKENQEMSRLCEKHRTENKQTQSVCDDLINKSSEMVTELKTVSEEAEELECIITDHEALSKRNLQLKRELEELKKDEPINEEILKQKEQNEQNCKSIFEKIDQFIQQVFAASLQEKYVNKTDLSKEITETMAKVNALGNSLEENRSAIKKLDEENCEWDERLRSLQLKKENMSKNFDMELELAEKELTKVQEITRTQTIQREEMKKEITQNQESEKHLKLVMNEENKFYEEQYLSVMRVKRALDELVIRTLTDQIKLSFEI